MVADGTAGETTPIAVGIDETTRAGASNRANPREIQAVTPWHGCCEARCPEVFMLTNDAVSTSSHHTSPRARVLLVEDDDDMRALLAEALRHDDFDVIEAIDGNALLDALLVDPGAYHVVVADVNLPELSGIDALAIAHLMNEAPLPDVLLVTAEPDERLLADARVAGAVGVLHKPLDLDDLRLVVRLLVSGPRRSSTSA